MNIVPISAGLARVGVLPWLGIPSPPVLLASCTHAALDEGRKSIVLKDCGDVIMTS